MKMQTILVASLLLLGAIAVAPAASADHIHCESPSAAVRGACSDVDDTAHLAACLLSEKPGFWLYLCLS